MKHILRLITGLLFLSNITVAQNAQWVRTIKSEGFDEVLDLATDNSGNVYVTGQIEYLAAFDDGFLLESAGIHDIFLAKFDSSGNRIWAKRAGARFGGEKGHSIAVDASGFVYICGELDDTSYFDTIQVLGRPANNTFVAKYSPDGHAMWVRHFETDSMNTRGYAIDVDDAGNVYACGATQNTVYYNGNLLMTTNGDYDAFVFKFDTDGNFVWIKQIGGTDSGKAYGIAVDGPSVYVTGYFAGTIHFPLGVTLNGYGGTDFFLAKFDTAGTIQWAKQGGDTGFDRGWDININVNGNIVCTGSFESRGRFGDDTLYSYGHGDMFLVSYDSNGNELWAVRGGGVEDDIGRNVTHDKNGNLYVGGDYAASAFFGPDQVTSNGFADAFIVSYDSSATTTRFARSFGGPYNDRGRGVGTDLNGNIYFSGEFDTNISFDSFNVTGDSLFDIYIVKFNSNQPPPPCNVSSTASSNDVSCSGLCDGNATAVGIGTGPFSYAWSTMPQQFTDVATGLCAGNYSVVVTDNVGCTSSSSVTITEPAPLSVSSTSVDADCNGSCNGEATVTATGNSPFTYDWSTSPAQHSAHATGLCAGNYSVIVTDQGGCSSTSSITITEPLALALSTAVVHNSTCAGCSNGSIDINVSGGTSPYTFSWSDGNTHEDRTNLGPGVYNVCVTDDHSCSVCDSYTITEPTTGISSIDDEILVKVFPNPVSALSTIQLSTSVNLKDYRLDLFSANGEKIKNIPSTDYVISFSTEDLSKGIYFMKLTDVKTGETVRVISISKLAD